MLDGLSAGDFWSKPADALAGEWLHFNGSSFERVAVQPFCGDRCRDVGYAGNGKLAFDHADDGILLVGPDGVEETIAAPEGVDSTWFVRGHGDVMVAAATSLDEGRIFQREGDGWRELPPLPRPISGLDVWADGGIVVALGGGGGPAELFGRLVGEEWVLHVPGALTDAETLTATGELLRARIVGASEIVPQDPNTPIRISVELQRFSSPDSEPAVTTFLSDDHDFGVRFTPYALLPLREGSRLGLFGVRDHIRGGVLGNSNEVRAVFLPLDEGPEPSFRELFDVDNQFLTTFPAGPMFFDDGTVGLVVQGDPYPDGIGRKQLLRAVPTP